jgi:3-oxoacyl-[acyl-carrier protein] reductase
MTTAFKNKCALITGGSRGIGAAIVKRLAREGAHVAFTYTSSSDKAEETAKAARAHGVRAIAIKADSSDAKAVTAAVERTVNELGGIDILVNNAGVFVMGPIDKFALADFDRTLAVNVRAVFVATQAAVKHMKEGGRIINIGSCNAERMPFPGGGVYAMSKSALQGLVQGLARDLGPRGITINNVQPGPIDTDMNPAGSEFAAMMIKQVLAVPRYGTADEVAAMVA